MINGDNYTISYYGRRNINPSVEIIANYTFFDFIGKGSNIKISFEADNPDNFYLNVLHASTFMAAFKKDLEARNAQIANSSSSGFPTGEIPVTKNEDSGSGSYQYTIGDLDDKINMALSWYNFFDNRLQYFEEERLLLSGYIVGAENGRVTQADIEDSANVPPTRLFPSPDTRPDEQKVEPLRVPALDGLNKNDAGSDTNGWSSTTMQTSLNSETTYINYEISKLTTLINYGLRYFCLISTGNFNFTIIETMSLYIETKNPNLQQRTVSILFVPNQIPNPFPPPPFISAPQTANYVATQINNAVNSAFGYSVNPASVLGSNVVLTANSSNLTQCAYIVSDAPTVGFGSGNEAAIRSRSTLWTGGYTYSGGTVPGTSSAHLDILNENIQRNTEATDHNSQIIQLNGQMEEWLTPFDTSFPLSKAEKDIATSWVISTTSLTTDSLTFDNLKSETGGHVFDSIDDPTLSGNINDRLTSLNSRKTNINNRLSEVTARNTEVITTLSTESLYDPRYSWLVNLTHRERGYYADKKREIDQETKRQREAANNSNTLNSMNSFG